VTLLPPDPFAGLVLVLGLHQDCAETAHGYRDLPYAIRTKLIALQLPVAGRRPGIQRSNLYYRKGSDPTATLSQRRITLSSDRFQNCEANSNLLLVSQLMVAPVRRTEDLLKFLNRLPGPALTHILPAEGRRRTADGGPHLANHARRVDIAASAEETIRSGAA
jgi:hypothetical protein